MVLSYGRLKKTLRRAKSHSVVDMIRIKTINKSMADATAKINKEIGTARDMAVAHQINKINSGGNAWGAIKALCGTQARVKPKTSLLYLGVLLDGKGTWKRQAEAAAKKARGALGACIRIFKSRSLKIDLQSIDQVSGGIWCHDLVE